LLRGKDERRNVDVISLDRRVQSPESGSEIRILALAAVALAFDGVARRVIQTPKPEPGIMRYELTDYEWVDIKPFLPNKPRGVPRVHYRRVLNGIFWVLRSGAPWRDLPRVYISDPTARCCKV
jgi:Putative transposase of IS4/5 family (DUF4096)